MKFSVQIPIDLREVLNYFAAKSEQRIFHIFTISTNTTLYSDLSTNNSIVVNYRTGSLCISLLYKESRRGSEHLYIKTATIGTFLKGTMVILHKKVHYYLLKIFRYLCTTKCSKKYQRLQFYCLYVPILDETPYTVTKCTVQSYQTNVYVYMYSIRN